MIKKIYFENFKCFDKAELAIENVTTLVGTNASGKTNAIEGMMILSEIVTGRDLSTILDGTKNGSGSIRGGSKGCGRFGRGHFTLGCLIAYDESIDLKYEVTIGIENRITIEAESLYEIKNKKEKNEFKTKAVNVNSGDIFVACNNGKKGRNPELGCIRFSSVISQIVTKLPTDTQYGKRIVGYSQKVIEDLKSILYLNPETSLMREYALINDAELKVNASNISAVLLRLCKDEKKKERLLEIMRRLPENEVADISFDITALDYVVLLLQEVYGNQTEMIAASQLSDGTLRCLAIIAALLSEKEGGMIVIEEVDNGIHPGRAKMLIKEISEIAAQRKIDILITTHNAVLLNALSRNNLMGVTIVYRDKADGSGKMMSLLDIHDMTGLLATGKLGDVFTDDRILKWIKNEKVKANYSWLEV